MLRYTFSFIILLLFFSCSSKKEIPIEKRFVNPVVVEEKQNSGFQIFFVRHAEKESDGTKDPSLKDIGFDRAKRLASHLRAAGITRVFSTNYKRTRQTAGPLAKLNDIDVEIYNPDLVDIEQILKTHKEGNVLVVGHSNTTPKLMNKLLGDKLFHDLDEKDYDNLFIISCFDDSKTATILKF